MLKLIRMINLNTIDDLNLSNKYTIGYFWWFWHSDAEAKFYLDSS